MTTGPATRARRVRRALLVLPAALSGAVVGALGSLAHAVVTTAGGLDLPVGLVLAVSLSATTYVVLGLLLGRPGVAAALVGWVVVVLVLGTPRPEGDVIVAGTATGTGWLFGGSLIGLVLAAVPWPTAGAAARR